MCSVLQHHGIGRRQTVETGFQSRHGVQARMIGHVPLLPGLGHTVRCEARKTGTDVQLLNGFVFSPGFDFFKPGFEVTGLHLAAVDTFTGNPFVTYRQQLVGPLTPGLLELKQSGSPLL
ncbi:hypothetical protein D3C81_1651890 [compost metagenome]